MRLSCCGRLSPSRSKRKKKMPTLFRQFHGGGRNRDSRAGGSSKRRSRSAIQAGYSSSSLARIEARREFVRTTSMATQDESYTNPESLPSVEVAYNMFQRVYPKFAETWAVDDLRDREYFHLEECQHVCMDYCGLGLFSYYQQVVDKATSSFGLAYMSANLPTHALYGTPEEGTTEFYVRKRAMEFLNISDTEYSMVFTASRGSAFRLLAESYPFHLNPKLLTVYDFESEAVNWMGECAKRKGAKIMSACFKWPSLRIGTSHLKKLLQEKKRRGDHAKGLFVFPVQSRMTGAKYSYQWMSQAQQNKWHVLLDASAMGPKDMDSLGLSLFRPDFIISSFYKVFGSDPTGFGCLFIKNTAIRSLHNSARARAVGVMRIVSMHNQFADGPLEKGSEDEDDEDSTHHPWGLRPANFHAASSFSGPYLTGMEAELEAETSRPQKSRRSWRSWRSGKKNGKLSSSREIAHSGVLSESDTYSMRDLAQYVGESGELDYEPSQLPVSGLLYSEEKLEDSDFEDDRDSEVAGGDNWENSLYLNGDTVDEIENFENLDGGLSDEGDVDGDDFDDDAQWASEHGHLSEIEEEDEDEDEVPSLLQSFSGQPISPIIEEEAEDLETEDESVTQTPVPDEQPPVSPAPSPSPPPPPPPPPPQYSNKVHPAVFPVDEDEEHEGEGDGEGEQGSDEDDAAYFETHSTRMSTESEAEYLEAPDFMRGNSSSDDEDSQQRGGGLGWMGRKFDRDEGLGVTLRGAPSHRKVKSMGEIPFVEHHFRDRGRGEEEEIDNSDRNTAAGLDDQGGADQGAQRSTESGDQHLQQFPTEAGGSAETSDYQKGGVRGLVRKFQSFRNNSLSKKEVDRADVEKSKQDIGSASGTGKGTAAGTGTGTGAGTGFPPVPVSASNGEQSLVRGNKAKMIARDGEIEGNVRQKGIDRFAGESKISPERRGDTVVRPSHDPNSREKSANGVKRRGAGIFGSIGSRKPPAIAPLPESPSPPSSSLSQTEDRTNSAVDAQLDDKDGDFQARGSERMLPPGAGALAAGASSRKVRFSDRDGGYSGESDVAQPSNTPSSANGSRSPLASASRPDRRDVSESRDEDFRTTHMGAAGAWSRVAPNESDRMSNASDDGDLSGSSDLEPSSSAVAVEGEREIGVVPQLRGVQHESSSSSFVAQNEPGQRLYGRDGERLFGRSPGLESNASASTPLHHLATPRKYSEYNSSSINDNSSSYRIGGTSRERLHDESLEYNGAKDLRNGGSIMHANGGRFDLRDNITLSRDVEFEDDEMYSERSSNASDLLASSSRRLGPNFAEDFTEIDMEDSDDDEAMFQSIYQNGGSSHGSSAPRRYTGTKDVPLRSYETGEAEDAGDNYEENLDDKLWEGEVDPHISCKGLDFADSLGLTKLNHRLRYLINWLVSSLLKLRHPGPNEGTPMVRIYGPKVKYDRGAAVSFNMFDWKGQLIQPGVVQRLADRSNIALGVGRLCNIVDPESLPDFIAEKERLLEEDDIDQGVADSFPQSWRSDGGKSPLRIPVVTAALGFVTTFEDVYKLWSFLAKFLDADFVSKEVWRYRSLDQQPVVV